MNNKIKLRTPGYYKNFHCISSECKDNCCVGGWQIDIDEETAEYYSTVNGDFGKKLRDNIDYDNLCFRLKDGKCPFLDNNNLCGIYKELGEEHIGIVCDQFPRFTEYFGSVKERGIGLACEEAAKIILTDRSNFSYSETDTDEDVFDDSEFDSSLADMLMLLRDEFMYIIEKTDYTFNQKMIIIINIAADFQNHINNNDYNSMNKLYKKKKQHDFNSCFISDFRQISFNELEQNMASVWYAYLELETLGDEWHDFTDKIMDFLHPRKIRMLLKITNMKAGKYSTIKAFEEYTKYLNSYYAENTAELENILKYYIFRYLLKASYDHDLFGKIQLAAANIAILRDMEIYRFIQNGNKFSSDDRMDIIHIFSREVEYSEDNLETLAEEFIFDDIFKSENIIKLFNFSY